MSMKTKAPPTCDPARIARYANKIAFMVQFAAQRPGTKEIRQYIKLFSLQNESKLGCTGARPLLLRRYVMTVTNARIASKPGMA